MLQHWISGVLCFGLVETAILYGYYLNWNDTGTKHNTILVIGIIFGACKRTLSRVVLQFVALGYGIVRPTLGDDLYRVYFLGGAYFILSLIYILSTNFPRRSSNVDDPEYNLVSLVILMLAGVDTTFYIWIITSINNIMTSLAARKQAMKYILYRNFRFILFISLFFTFAWVVYSSAITVTNGKGDLSNWKYKWTVDAMWEFIYFVLLLIVCVLWSPHKNNHRYSFSYETVSLDDDAEWLNAGKDVTADSDDVEQSSNTQSTDTSNINSNNNSNSSSSSSSSNGSSSSNNKNGQHQQQQPLKRKSLLDDSDDEDETMFAGGGGALDSKTAMLKKN